MTDLRVTAPFGVTLKGPLVLILTKDQHALRRDAIGQRGRSGKCVLDGGQSVSFKAGEIIGIDPEDLDKISAASFAPIDEDTALTGEDTAAGGNDTETSGDDTGPGGEVASE